MNLAFFAIKIQNPIQVGYWLISKFERNCLKVCCSGGDEVGGYKVTTMSNLNNR